MRTRHVTCAMAIATVIVAACGTNVTPAPDVSSEPGEAAFTSTYRFPPPRPQAPAPLALASPEPTTWRTYASDAFGYEIRYPPTWAVKEGHGPFADEIDDRDLPWLFVRRGLADTDTTTVAEAVTDDIRIQKRDDHAVLVSAHPITLPGGYEGMFLLYHGRIQVGPVALRRIIVSKGPVFYYFSLYGQPWTETADTALFEQIYASWKPT